jgi:hypothetical protein
MSARRPVQAPTVRRTKAGASGGCTTMFREVEKDNRLARDLAQMLVRAGVLGRHVRPRRG